MGVILMVAISPSRWRPSCSSMARAAGRDLERRRRTSASFTTTRMANSRCPVHQRHRPGGCADQTQPRQRLRVQRRGRHVNVGVGSQYVRSRDQRSGYNFVGAEGLLRVLRQWGSGSAGVTILVTSPGVLVLRQLVHRPQGLHLGVKARPSKALAVARDVRDWSAPFVGRRAVLLLGSSSVRPASSSTTSRTRPAPSPTWPTGRCS